MPQARPRSLHLPRMRWATGILTLTVLLDLATEGGDDRLRDLIFRNVSVPDYMRLPDSRAAAISCLTGLAALRSQDEGRPVRLAELLRS